MKDIGDPTVAEDPDKETFKPRRLTGYATMAKEINTISRTLNQVIRQYNDLEKRILQLESAAFSKIMEESDG